MKPVTNRFVREDPAMKRVTINDKRDIKQLLYGDYVLGVQDGTCPSFGGFQLWWYDRQHGLCQTCRARWSDLRKTVERCSLDQAAKILWQNRKALFLRNRHFSEDRRLRRLAQLCN
jgi:hypothetical protein